MSLAITVRRGASAFVFVAAIGLGTTGCGQPTQQAGAQPTTAPAQTTPTPAPSTSATTAAEPPAAGADASTTAIPVEPGTGSVDGPQVAQSVSTKLTEVVGQSPDSVTCPDDLAAKIGATIRCTLVSGPDTYGVTVTTTSVRGSDVAFDIKVDDQPS